LKGTRAGAANAQFVSPASSCTIDFQTLSLDTTFQIGINKKSGARFHLLVEVIWTFV